MSVYNNTVLTNLSNVTGGHVPYTRQVRTTGSDINADASSNFDPTHQIDPSDVPTHGIPLDNVDGYIATQSDSLTFTWGNLTPATVYQIFVFGHSSGVAE